MLLITTIQYTTTVQYNGTVITVQNSSDLTAKLHTRETDKEEEKAQTRWVVVDVEDHPADRGGGGEGAITLISWPEWAEGVLCLLCLCTSSLRLLSWISAFNSRSSSSLRFFILSSSRILSCLRLSISSSQRCFSRFTRSSSLFRASSAIRCSSCRMYSSIEREFCRWKSGVLDQPRISSWRRRASLARSSSRRRCSCWIRWTSPSTDSWALYKASFMLRRTRSSWCCSAARSAWLRTSYTTHRLQHWALYVDPFPTQIKQRRTHITFSTVNHVSTTRNHL